MSQAGEDAGFYDQDFSWAIFMTIHDMDLTGFGYAGSCREFSSPGIDFRSTPTGWVEEKQKLTQCWKSRLRITCINMDLKSKIFDEE